MASYLQSFCDPLIPTAAQEVWAPRRVAELAGDAAGLITCMADRVDEAFLARCRALRVVSGTLKGYDNLDAEACARRGVWLTILPDMLTVPTAELTVGLAIGIMRHIGAADRLIRRDGYAGWRPRFYGSGLSGATAGILGMGQVGRAVAIRLRAFGARIVYHDIRPLPAAVAADLGAARLPLAAVLAESDVVLLLLPLTPATRHLIDAARLALMKPGGYLVNAGRGSVVDEQAVANALQEGRLAGYAADVFAMEDTSQPDRPDQIPAALLRHPRTLFTPHLGSAVESIRLQMSMVAARQVWQVLTGQRPDHAVNSPRLAPGHTVQGC